MDPMDREEHIVKSRLHLNPRLLYLFFLLAALAATVGAPGSGWTIP